MTIEARFAFPWLLPLALAACAAETAAPVAQTPVSDDLAAAEEPLVIADIDFASGQKVLFLATGPDEISVQESGALGATPVLISHSAASLADLYRQIADSPDPEVVATLERADRKAVQLALSHESALPAIEEPVEQPAPARAGDVGVAKLAFSMIGSSPWMNASQFQATACNTIGYDTGVCWLNTWGGDTGFTDELSLIYSTVMHAWSSGTVTHTERKWFCTTELPFGGCLSGKWKTTATQTIHAGQYGLFSSTNRRVRYISSTTDAAIHHGAVWTYH